MSAPEPQALSASTWLVIGCGSKAWITAPGQRWADEKREVADVGTDVEEAQPGTEELGQQPALLGLPGAALLHERAHHAVGCRDPQRDRRP